MTRALRHLLFAVLAALPAYSHALTFSAFTDSTSAYAACQAKKNEIGGSCQLLTSLGSYWSPYTSSAGWQAWYIEGFGYPFQTNCGHLEVVGNKCLPACQVDEVRNPETGDCESNQPPTCEPGQHVEYNQCVPDNCPSGQAWNSSKNSCYPTSPPPDTSQPAPTTYLPVGSHDPNDPNRTVTPLPGLSTGLPANCGGWQCTYSTGEYDPAAGCWDYESSPGITHCGFKPTYTQDAEGNPIPYVGEPTNEPPSYTAPPPVNSEAPPPVLCPINYYYNPTLGLCTTGQSPGTPPTLEGPGSQPTPGTGSCPLGYVQQPDGRCTATAPSTSCPQGYYLVDGKCVSYGGYDPSTGTPGGSNGAGNGTCGGPGQPPCKIDLGGPGDIEGPQLFELPEFEFDLTSLQPIDLGAPVAQCPPDVQLPRGIVWSWATTCSFAEWMRPIFLGMAWLFAGFIVLSGIPRD